MSGEDWDTRSVLLFNLLRYGVFLDEEIDWPYFDCYEVAERARTIEIYQ